MDGLHQVVDTETVIELDGKTYRLAPLKARHFAQIERHLLQTRPDPLEELKPRLDGLPEHLQRHLVGLAYDRLLSGPRVSADELGRWMNSPEGTGYTLWLAIRENHPEVTLPVCQKFVEAAHQDAFEKIQRQLDEASGVPRGNSTGQAQSHEKHAGQTTRSRGAASSVN